MSIRVGFGDLVKCVEIAKKTYKYGFSKAYRAHTLYNEFGGNIKSLAANLDDLQKIVGYVAQNNGGRFLDSSYMISLADIIGDYGKTLQDCNKFLGDKERFSWQGDFINNIHWNFSIASEVQTLKDRVTFLNIKLGTVLKTLDLQMVNQLHIDIFRIHEDLAVRIGGAEENIIQAVQAAGDGILDYLQSQNGNRAVPPSSRPSPNTLTISPSLQGLFELEVQGTDFDTDTDRFPLLLGLDAIIYHIYTADTIAADSKEMKWERQWLAIAKALWILPRVKSGKEYKDTCSLPAPGSFERQISEMGITVTAYIGRLEMRIAEIVKSSAMNSIPPEDGTILQIFREAPEMWLPLKEDAGPTPTWELEYSENIMDASLRGPYPGFNQSLHLFKLTDVDLKLVITDSPKPSIDSRASNIRAQQTNNIINVDIRRSRFIPLYAASQTPMSSALNVKFQGDRLASGSSALIFNKPTELFKFQHAITGYQVVLESLNIGVTTYMAARMIGGTQTEYTGRLQLWRAKRAQNSATKEKKNGSSAPTPASSNSGGSASTIQPVEVPGSPVPNSSLSSSPRSPRDNRDSFFSLPSPGPSARNSTLLSRMTPVQTNQGRRRDSTLTEDSRFGSVGRRDSTWTVNSAATSTTAATAVSLAASGTMYTTTVVSHDGTVGLILDPPRPSLLVLLLQKSTKKGVQYSTLAVDIDDNTVIDPSSCKCRKDPNSCLRVVIQRSGSGGALTSIRQYAETDLERWNLAAFGGAQRKVLEKEQSGGAKERLSWVAVDFSGIEEKKVFEKGFDDVKLLLAKERAAYNLTRTRLQH